MPAALTRPRRRSMRDRLPASTGWWLRGYPAGGDHLHPRRVLVTYAPGGTLTGDPNLCAHALLMAQQTRTDMRDPRAALALLRSLYLPGAEAGGDLPQP